MANTDTIESASAASDTAARSSTMQGRDLWAKRVPIALLGALLLLFALFVLTQYDAYGRTWDEGWQQAYGDRVLRWYASGGSDLSFMQFAPELNMPQHGPLVETVISAAQHIFGGQWGTRSLVGGLIGALGVVAIALCGFELAGWWGAFLAAAGLAMYPRYTGAMFNNSKDIPLAVAMVFILWAALRLMRRWDAGTTAQARPGRRLLGDSAMLGLFIGVAASIRVNALIWYGLLGLVVVGWWIRHGRQVIRDGSWTTALKRQTLSATVVCGMSYLAMLAFWPFIFLHPISGLASSVRSMSKYDWNSIVMFSGTMVRAMDLPWFYGPKWLVVGSPLPVVVLAVAAAALLGWDVLRRRPLDARVVLVLATFVLPLALVIGLGSTMYNSLRHILFVVPSMVLVAVYGLGRTWTSLMSRRRILAACLAGLVLLGQAEAVVASARLFPYEYTYFSPVVGGFVGAHTRYEVDYWRSCESEAARWLSEHYRDYTSDPTPAVGGTFDPLIVLPPQLQKPGEPQFYIGHYDFSRPPASFVRIHEVARQGMVFCTVNVRP